MASAELLKQIQAGKSLKKAVTNDRSAPAVDSGKGSGARSSSLTPAPPAGAGAGNNIPMGGPPQLGALFAGGMPKLKPAGQSTQAKTPVLGKPPTIPRVSKSPQAEDVENTPSSKPSRNIPPAPVRTVPTPERPAPTHPVPVPARTVSTTKPTIPAPPPARGRAVPPAPPRPTAGPSRPVPPLRPTSAVSESSGDAPNLPPRAPPNLPARTGPPPPPRSVPPRRSAAPLSRPSPPTTPARPPIPPRGNSPRAESPNGASPVARPLLSSTSSPGRLVPSVPGRPAPPPPPRPLSISSSTLSRAVPPPPGRNPSEGLPPRVRVLSESETPVTRRLDSPESSSRAPPPPPSRSAPITARVVPTTPERATLTSTIVSGSLAPPPVRRVSPSAQAQPQRNGGSAPSRKIPSPPPSSGTHTFPVNDFPPPREFREAPKQYTSGRTRGSDFDLRVL